MMDQVSPPNWADAAYLRLSDDQRAEQKQRVLDTSPYADEFWVFGFGSLMWNPGVETVAQQTATVDAFERKFHIWSTVGRGTKENPGLGCCLEHTGGSCRGLAFSTHMDNLESDLDYLWGREMGSGIYIPTWVQVKFDDDEGTKKIALTFVVDKDHVQYAGPMPVEQMAAYMSGACGKYGKCRDYLANTIDAMAKMGDSDPMLDDLLALIDAG